MAREWFQVRVREKVGPDKWMKKSKFFRATSPRDAASKYKGGGMIMWVGKVRLGQVDKVGDFFRLGDQFLRELRREGNVKLEDEVKAKRKIN